MRNVTAAKSDEGVRGGADEHRDTREREHQNGESAARKEVPERHDEGEAGGVTGLDQHQ